jgi:hypothetical protein
LDLNLRNELLNSYTLSTAFYGAEIWTLRRVDQKYTGSSEMWYWRRNEKIVWKNGVRNKVLNNSRKN